MPNPLPYPDPTEARAGVADAEDGRRRRARQRRDATHDALVRAATTAFAREGYVRATPASIARWAGVTRATFYQHFRSKADAFTAVLDDLADRLGAAVVGIELGSSADPPEVQLTDNLLRVLDILLDDQDLARLLLIDGAGKEAMLQGHVQTFYAHVHVMLRTALAQGAALGLVRPLTADIVAHALLGAVQAVMTARLAQSPLHLDSGDAGREIGRAEIGRADSGPMERAEIARELLDFCLYGVMTAGWRQTVLGPREAISPAA